MTDERRLDLVVLHRNGASLREIARKLRISKNTVASIVQKHRNRVSVKDLPGRGRKKTTTKRQDHRLVFERTSLDLQ